MGRICAFTHCSNSTYKLERWKAKQCQEHNCRYDACNCQAPFKLLCFPNANDEVDRRREWTHIVNRKDLVTGKNWRPDANSRICSQHFVDGNPSDILPNPTINISHKGDSITPKRKAPTPRPFVKSEPHTKKTKVEIIRTQHIDHNYHSICSCTLCMEKDKKIKDLENQIDNLTEELQNKCTVKITEEERNLSSRSIAQKFLNTDEKVNIYTGLPTRQALYALYSHVEERAKKMRYWLGSTKVTCKKAKRKFRRTPEKSGPKRGISPFNELALTLMKIRMGLTNQLLADIFSIKATAVSQILNTWLKFLSKELSPLIFWPDRETINLMMPPSLSSYKNLRCTIDCSETFIQRPRNLEIQALTWSDYKKHNTVKYLVAIAPNGMISFVSKAWGGRASDKHIVKESGFLDLVESYDLVLADRGFTIREDLMMKLATLEIPPPSGGVEQMTRSDVLKTKKVANGRIHVERAIGRMKWFAILKKVLPVTLVPLIDDILIVIAALSNLRKPLVY